MMIKALLTMIHYECLLTLRQAFSWLTPLLFFIMVVCFFPLALGSDHALLHTIAAGIIWVAAVLAILLSLNNLFQRDAQEGYLELFLLSSYPLTLVVFCKVVSHWIIYCVPLLLLTPVLALLLNLSFYENFILILTLLLGTPVLCLLGAVGAALTVSLRHQSLLLPILIMPFYIPILIFGTSTLVAANSGQLLNGYFAILAALGLLCFAFAPFLAALALRIGVSQ